VVITRSVFEERRRQERDDESERRAERYMEQQTPNLE
jgi:hypothetical protein